MDQYGFWNPRGTTNSEYGNFVFQNRLHGHTGSVSNFMGHNNQNQHGWENQHQHQHLPGCQNYQNQKHHGHTHHPTCPNANNSNYSNNGHWAEGDDGTYQYQNPGHAQAYGGGEGPNFTVQVGEEAAAAALGGKGQFQAQFSKSLMPRDSCVSVPGVGKGHQLQQDTGESASDPQSANEYQMSQLRINSDQTAADNANDNEANGKQEETNAQTTPDVDVGGSGESVQPMQANDTQSQPNPPPEAVCQPKPRPAKWRGLPRTGQNAVKFGRHIPPSYMRTQSHMKLSNVPMMDQQMPVMMEPLDQNAMMSNMNNCIKNTLMNRTPSPRVNSSTGTRVQPNRVILPNPPSLCGKCTKCKTYLPPTQGPSTMTFPSNSSQNLRKPNVRHMHTMGAQDAKNFRAFRNNYHN